MRDNSFPSFRQYLLKCNDFSEQELDYIESKMSFSKKSKKAILLHEGEISSFEAFILKGLVISYFLNEDGNKVVLSFATENWWVTDMDSLHNAKESKMFIEVLEDSEILILEASDKTELLKKVPKLERMFRILVERHLINYQQRIFGNIALSGKDRYQSFQTKYPQLLQRVPQHLIASYLGITPEFLSRIRKDKN
jgi:CRP/FNR family transcriptional regulator, cyclic AMP receptor protein